VSAEAGEGHFPKTFLDLENKKSLRWGSSIMSVYLTGMHLNRRLMGVYLTGVCDLSA
jgi:hypothetical protein